MSGTLYVAATPIGNLDDITFRTVDILRKSSLILCENKREALKLLNHLSIHCEVISIQFRDSKNLEWILSKLKSGVTITLISDSGTPGISDPGSHLIRFLRENDIPISPLPGPSALSTILSISGFQVNPSLFLGFLPDSDGKVKKELAKYKDFQGLIIVFISLYRLKKTMNAIFAQFPQASFLLGREMTKFYEEFVYLPEPDPEKIEKIPKKGEFTVLINNSKKNTKEKSVLTEI